MKNERPDIDLKNYFCTQPFTYTEFHRQGNKRAQYICCPDWNDVNIYESDDLLSNWNSEKVEEIRKGHLSGNFVGCKPDVCPALNTLLNTGKAVLSVRPIKEWDAEKYIKKAPQRLKICSDDACNLKCPTCRSELKPNNEERTTRVRGLLNNIEKDYSLTLEEIFTSGGGDPFYSTPMREFLQSITKEKFPNLKRILLHTNGILFTPKVWDKMKSIHPYVDYVEISIDAATKNTYENKVRLNGKWDVLIENLNFIKTIDTINCVQLDYVVQKVNFREMEPFVKLMSDIFRGARFDLVINFQKVWPWPTISPEDYKEMCVWEKSHSDYNDFLIEIDKIKKYDFVVHNLHEHLDE